MNLILLVCGMGGFLLYELLRLIEGIGNSNSWLKQFISTKFYLVSITLIAIIIGSLSAMLSANNLDNLLFQFSWSSPKIIEAIRAIICGASAVPVIKAGKGTKIIDFGTFKGESGEQIEDIPDKSDEVNFIWKIKMLLLR